VSDLKAYAVLEDSENTGGIVFAKHAIVARREGSSQFGSGEFEGWSCRRAPWADAWADSDEDVPAKLMIEHGWHFECCGCGHKIDEDWLNDEGLPLDGVSGTQHSRVYCSEICECHDNLRRAIARGHERRAISALKEFVLKRFPGIAFEQKDNSKPHAYASESKGVWQVRQAVVAFGFPGMKIGPATCRIDRDQSHDKFIGPIWPEFSCCFGDKEAFETWAASPESRAKISEAA
jgi:hypothetical protein